MKFNVLALAFAVTLTAIVGCGKENRDSVAAAIDHAKDEGNKAAANVHLRGKWESACDAKGLLWAAAGIKSEKIVYDFFSKTAKTSQLFADENCQQQVGEAMYSGTAAVGAPTADRDVNILDLNFTKVEVKITDKKVADALNVPLVPGCGINDWAVNVVRDVTSSAGTPVCPLAKPSQSFDIVKSDGRTMHLGLADPAHNKAAEANRPVALDTAQSFSKK